MKSKKKSNYDRFSLTLPPELNDWLYTVTRSIKNQGGYRIPKTTLIRSMLRAFRESSVNINLKNIKNKELETFKIGGLTNSDEVENLLVSRIKEILKK